jgi:hypothetical protein
MIRCAFALLILLCSACRDAAVTLPDVAPVMPGRELFRCSFDGPYSPGPNPIQANCQNNWDWGRKVVRLAAEPAPGRPGLVQRIDIDEVHSGAMQFFVGALPAMARSRFYRVSFQLRAEGLGRLNVQVRKIGNPWTCLIAGPTIEAPATAWTRYEFSGACSTDIDTDHAILFSSSEPGTLWIDDVVLEALPGDPGTQNATADFPALPGNQLPRSSCEAGRDIFWTGGVYGDPDAEWEDPQPQRSTDAFAGRHSLAIPCSTQGGTVFCRSGAIPFAPGRSYTTSLWMRATVPGTKATIGLRSFRGAEFACSKTVTLGTAWERYTVTSPTMPAGVRLGYINLILPKGQSGEVHLDAVQVELGETATTWMPAHPVELAAGLADGQRLITWGDQAVLRLEAWPAADQAPAAVPAEVVVTRQPSQEVLRRSLVLVPGTPTLLPLGPTTRGLLRIELRAFDAAVAAPVETLFASLPQPRALGAAGSFGIHLSIRPEFIDYARRIGYTWVRCHDGTAITKWATGEPATGRFRWFDRQVDALRAAGFAILGLPDADRKNWPAHQRRDGAPMADAPAFARWCEAAAAHYRGRIDHWEMWNEPYMAYFWPFGVDGYASMIPAGMAAIRRGNPQAVIIGACNELNSGNWKDPLPAELKSAFDIGSYHSYQNNLAGGSESLRTQLAEYGRTYGAQAPRELWNSEGGAAAMNGNTFLSVFGDTTALNARAVALAARVLIEHRGAGSRFFHYTMHQGDSLMYHGIGYKMMIGYDRSPTPAAVATAIAAWAIDGLDAAPLPAPAAAGLVENLFSGRSRLTWTIFRETAGRGRDMVVDLSALPADAEVVDCHGQDPRNDAVQWPIGIAPLFVLCASPTPSFAAACQAAVRPMSVENKP